MRNLLVNILIGPKERENEEHDGGDARRPLLLTDELHFETTTAKKKTVRNRFKFVFGLKDLNRNVKQPVTVSTSGVTNHFRDESCLKSISMFPKDLK